MNSTTPSCPALELRVTKDLVCSSPTVTLSRQAHLQSKYFRSEAPGEARNDDGGFPSSPGNSSRRSIVNGGETKFCFVVQSFTPYCLSPYDDHLLPSKFGLGLTDLVSRPTTEANELAPVERREAVPILLEKIRKFQPRFLCFVGIKQYQDLCIYLKKKRKSQKDKLIMGIKKTNIGLQDIVFKSHKIHLLNSNDDKKNSQTGKSTTSTKDWTYTFIFVCPSTSALVRNYEVRVQNFFNIS
ncbi:hypothetical protein VP01_987g3 [Puccinia sorghi]|uniref:Uracil-DNA glycosylase-like domain-containing protein n=1 Tax=Puccinia sorghi TaxID=27349 RepID=A0A0L6U608_9BASI|nr:hypothetical protein VP01_987g3 [Puccinia sorghi]